ncbi:MAG TPA: YdcF family protein [Roseiflexaceae bacterium]|nr:YdcF family protein [Roseiflexaceae bacterium]
MRRRTIDLRQIGRGIARSLLLALLSLILLVALICVLITFQGRRDETKSAGAAVVLGAAQWNGSPSPVLQARLDHALDLYRRGTVGKIILTGGVGQGDSVSEAAAGRDYLVQHGVTTPTLLLEQQGTTTWESMQNAAELARANGINSVLLVSDAYHMLRSLKMAHDLGLNAYASPIRPANGIESLDEAMHVLREAGAYLLYVFARE